MAIKSVKDILSSASDAYVKAEDYESKVADDTLQYSAWILAVATAGFAITITQTDKILEGASLDEIGGQALINFGSICFGVSAVIGSLIKIRINKLRQLNRQTTTLIL